MPGRPISTYISQMTTIRVGCSSRSRPNVRVCGIRAVTIAHGYVPRESVINQLINVVVKSRYLQPSPKGVLIGPIGGGTP